MQAATTTGPVSRSRRHAGRGAWLLLSLTLALSVVTLVGFAPRYYWPLLTGQPLRPLARHWGIHLHAVLNLAWLACFALQIWLVVSNRTDLHRRLGPWFAAYGVVLVVLNYWLGLTIEAQRVALGATVDQVIPLTFAIVVDLVMFAGFLVAGIVYRRNIAAHRALMFLATYSLIVVGFGRFLGMLVPYVAIWILIVVFLAPLVVAGFYDWRKRGGQHYLYLAGGVLYLFLRSPAQAIWLPAFREHWLPIGRALLQPFL